MEARITKAAQIMALHQQGKTTREIALAVYGEAIDKRMAYVRIVVRQRKGKGTSEAETRWRTSPHGRPVYNATKSRYQKARYRSDPVYRATRLAQSAAWKARRQKSQATNATNHV